MKRRILANLLALCMMYMVLPKAVYASETASEDLSAMDMIEGITYSYEQRTLNADYYITLEDAGNRMRELLLKRRPNINIGIVTQYYSEDDIQAQLDAIIAWAIAHTGVPNEGDYLAGHVTRLEGEIEAAIDEENGIAYVDYILYLGYLGNRTDEEEVTAYVDDFVSALADKDVYTKLRAVYDHICENVNYETVEPDEADWYKHGPFAVKEGSATERGIAVFFYRMALELGIDCRIIYGTVNGQDHAWNIVEIDGVYYNVDAALDAGKTEYSYFLKTDESFSDHIRYEEYATEEVYEYYPMGKKDIEHKFGEGVVITTATCSQAGLEIYTCETCGYEYEKTIYDGDHTFDGGEYAWEPGCNSTGWITYTCIHCGFGQSERLPVLGHDFANVTPDSYEEQTYTHTYACSRCEEIKSEACTFDEGEVISEATIDGLGTRKFTCILCDGSYEETYAYRIFGNSRYDTGYAVADALKEQLGVDAFENIIVASGMGYADALAGSYLAAVKNAPILLVNERRMEEVAEYIRANLASDGTVYILGGENAVPAAMEETLGGFNVKRLEGQGRYATNMAILEEAGTEGQEILICTGRDFPDSLSASAVGKPILLVNKTLYDYQMEFLANSSGEFVIIGGTGAVSEDIEKELAEFGEITRLDGSGRYETCVKVAKHFFPEGTESAIVAYSRNFPDGLCGGPLAYAMKAPLLLLQTGRGPEVIEYAKETGIKTGAVLGGTGLIDDATVNQVFVQ